jgi:hypothetical protein
MLKMPWKLALLIAVVGLVDAAATMSLWKDPGQLNPAALASGCALAGAFWAGSWYRGIQEKNR